MIKVEEVYKIESHRVYTNEGVYTRYSSSSWGWCIGESEESIFDKQKIKELEEAFQIFNKNKRAI